MRVVVGVAEFLEGVAEFLEGVAEFLEGVAEFFEGVAEFLSMEGVAEFLADGFEGDAEEKMDAFEDEYVDAEKMDGRALTGEEE